MLASITIISYTAAAIAYLLLALLLLTDWRGRLYGKMLMIACLFSTVWAVAIACQATWGYPAPYFTGLLEIFRSAAWTALLITLLSTFQQASGLLSPRLRLSLIIITGLYFIFLTAYSYSYASVNFFFRESVDFMAGIFGSVVMAIVGVILVEQFYRNTPIEELWGIKYICLGIGGTFIYDFYLYSDALLFRIINVDLWAARGVINALTVPLIAISVVRNPKWATGIMVSRNILFYSATLFSTAIYLLLMAAVSYYLRFSGGSWGVVLQMTFLFGAAVLLIGVLFSGTIRSWLKVFISKHFFRYNYDYREEWLRFTRTLSAGSLDLKSRSIQALAQLVESPGGGLWLKGKNRYEPVARWNMPAVKETEILDSKFCQFVEEKGWVADIQDSLSSPANYVALSLPNWIQRIPQAWLIAPLILHEKMLGFVILLQPRSSVKLNWEVTDLLKVAGNQAASYLAQEEAAKALLVARQFESFNRMSTFVVHDLKNLVFQLSLLLSNVKKHKNNPEFQDDMIKTVDLSVNKMSRLLEKLRCEDTIEKSDRLILDSLLPGVVKSKSAYEPKPELTIQNKNLVVFANRVRLERVLGHLIQNAIEATPKNGRVCVRSMKRGDVVIIEIKDSGHGMSEKFIEEHLFSPFESTKSAGMGIGVFESREYILELGGELKVTSNQSVGTIFHIVLPLCNHRGV